MVADLCELRSLNILLGELHHIGLDSLLFVLERVEVINQARRLHEHIREAFVL